VPVSILVGLDASLANVAMRDAQGEWMYP